MARDARTTVAGLAVGALVVASLAGGSSVFALLASFIAIAASMVSPLVGMIALAFAAPLARPLVIPPPGLYLAMMAAMLLGLILRLPVERPRLRLPSAEVLLLGAFLLYAAAQFLGGRLDGLSGARSAEVASDFARLAEAVVTFGIAYVVLRGRSPYPILTALLASAALASVSALAELLGVDGAFGNLMDAPDASGRISGIFANPNYLGAYLGSMTALAIALAVEARSTRLKALLLALTSLLSATLLFTQSRGALVATIAGFIMIAFVRSRRAGIMSIAALTLVVVIAYPAFSDWRFGGDDVGASSGISTAGGRVGAWSAGGELFASSPLFGIGLGRFGEESPGGISAHNWYVQVLVELGIVGFILWSLFIAATVMALRGRPRSARSVGYSVLVVWMVASLTMSPQQEFRLTSSILIAIAAAATALWTPARREIETPTLRGPQGPARAPVLAGPYERVTGRGKPRA